MVMIIAVSIWYLQTLPVLSASREGITIGFTLSLHSALVFVAYNNGFFVKNGINETLKPYDSKSRSLQDFSEGAVDFASASHYPCTWNIGTETSLRIVSIIARADANAVVARKYRGIAHPVDLARIIVGRRLNMDFLDNIDTENLTGIKPAGVTGIR